MKAARTHNMLAAALVSALAATSAQAQSAANVSAEAPSFRPASIEEQMIYQRGFEAVIWAMPFLDVLQIRAELVKHGATDGTLAYFGARPTGKIEVLTYNTTTPYVFGNVSLKHGPVVIDVPAASEKAKFFGPVFNVWCSPIEDFGPSGVDQGKGGKFVLLPPGFTGEVPQGYTKLQSSSYEVGLLLRTVPARAGDEGWNDAVEYLQTLQLYPLAEAAAPKPTKWLDVSKVEGYFHGNPSFDLSAFTLINQYAQDESVRTEDLVMHGMLARIGIQKGKPFAPDAKTKTILEAAAHDAGIYMRGVLESNGSFEQFWADRTWGGINLTPEIVAGGAMYDFADRQDYQARAVDLYYWACCSPKRLDSSGGGATFYLLTAKDEQDRPLDGRKTYRLHLPANVPAKDFWSLMLYSTRTRSFTDSPKFGLSSKDSPEVNADGSVDLYIGPKAPKGKESNWLATKAGDGAFAIFRFFGPTEAVANKTWMLGDFEEVK